MGKIVGMLLCLFLLLGMSGCSAHEEEVDVSKELQKCGVDAVYAVDDFLDGEDLSDEMEWGSALEKIDECYSNADEWNQKWKKDEDNKLEYGKYSAIQGFISKLRESMVNLKEGIGTEDEVRERRNTLAERLDIAPLKEKEEESLSAALNEDAFGDMLDAFQGEWRGNDSKSGRLIISDVTVNFVYEMEIGGKETCDVHTFYFGFDEDENLVVNNSYSQPIYTVMLDESGVLTVKRLYGSDDDETYEKISNNTEVPATKVDPAIGMTESEVYESTWGYPKNKNKTTTANGVHEQWVYDFGYIYLDDGYVTAIQE